MIILETVFVLDSLNIYREHEAKGNRAKEKRREGGVIKCVGVQSSEQTIVNDKLQY